MAVTAWSQILPTSLSDLVSQVISGCNDGEVAAAVKLWNGFWKPAFDAFVAAKMPPETAVQIVFNPQFARRSRLQRFSLQLNGQASSIRDDSRSTTLGGSLGFAGIPGLPITAQVSGSQTTTSTQSVTTSLADTLQIEVGPDDAAFEGALLSAIGGSGMPLLPIPAGLVIPGLPAAASAPSK